jgi:hypothetical protein
MIGLAVILIEGDTFRPYRHPFLACARVWQVNPKHPLVVGLDRLRMTDDKDATLIAEQVIGRSHTPTPRDHTRCPKRQVFLTLR